MNKTLISLLFSSMALWAADANTIRVYSASGSPVDTKLFDVDSILFTTPDSLQLFKADIKVTTLPLLGVDSIGFVYVSSSGGGTAIAGMVPIPAGCFQMGSTNGDSDEQPVHQDCVSAFQMDKYEVTQAEYTAYKGSNPSYFKSCGTNCPVETVNWTDADAYCKSKGKRLPTEAEWEYAARGGTTTTYYWGDATDDATVGKYAWFSSNSGRTTHTVGQKLPNAYGLYDMSGNVWEWVSDWYGSSYYSSSPSQDPTGPSSGSYRVNRGGSWDYGASFLRSALRGYFYPTGTYDNLGFRCVSP